MMTTDSSPTETKQRLLTMMIGALGIVYGDIGTSPLYALKECFYGDHAVPPTLDNVLGVLSLVFWSLIIVISLKYVIFIMRADNHGEGGILALMALTLRKWGEDEKKRWWLIILGIFGAALFYGDSIITPAISVLSAVEGLEVASPLFKVYVIPITIAILIVLFLFQRKGTAKVGALFGPIMCFWFVCLAILGFNYILKMPSVLMAVNPVYAVKFFFLNGWQGFIVLGGVVLVMTGGEALYADMGHFGKMPIRYSWFWLVLPALLINYFGQGALLIGNPAANENPFYMLVPPWALYPMVILATIATIIASQAVISGAFSLTRQAVQLGFCPRLKIDHTSEEAIGQIYIPWINWIMLIAIIALVLGFKTSGNLAAAYGIAVTGTMLITTLLAFVALRHSWGWSPLVSGLVAAVFIFVDFSFFTANAIKIPNGGWFPLVIGLILFTFLSTWKRGREIVAQKLKPIVLPLTDFLEMMAMSSPLRVPGTAIFMTRNQDGVPSALLHNLKHNKVLHERVIFVTILTQDVPRVEEAKRVEVHPLGDNFYRITAYYGFKEDPNILGILEQTKSQGLEFEMMETTFFLSREILILTSNPPPMALWREKLFIGMLRNARSATDFFKIPSNRVIELGAQIEI